MYRALTAEQSNAVEKRAVAEIGVTLEDLMRSAGVAVAQQVDSRVPTGRVVVACGAGNNGGDGWVAATELHRSGREVVVVTLKEPGELGDLAARAAAGAVAEGVAWRAGSPGAVLEGAAVVVDALLGTGSRLPLREPLAAWCEAINHSGAYVVSVDAPSGVDVTNGLRAPEAVVADCTVTFTAPKVGLVQFPGAECAGEVVVVDIGIPAELANVEKAPELWTAEEYRALLPSPAADAHKNLRGRVLVVAGSRSFPGAAILAVRGAMRMGAGYVTLALPGPMVPVAQAHLLAAPVVGLPTAGRALSSAATNVVRSMAPDYDAVVLGPGLTVADGAAATAHRLVSALDRPMVIDADGLNAFVDNVSALQARQAPTVLTPHPGELARLLCSTSAEIQADRMAASSRLAGESRTVVLKGAGTVIAGEGRTVINTSGSVALATAGTGDVLAGMVGALLAQGLTPLQAGALGAFVHGLAGEAAARDLTELCVTAEDLPEYIPSAVAELLESFAEGRS